MINQNLREEFREKTEYDMYGGGRLHPDAWSEHIHSRMHTFSEELLEDMITEGPKKSGDGASGWRHETVELARILLLERALTK